MKNLVLGCCVATLVGLVACGSTGAGADGTNGTNGSDGATGTAGADGTNGTPGAAGSNGTNGDAGAPGANGTNGADGTNGSNGSDGTNGSDGANGTNGSDGTNGATGDQGEQGNQGTNGDISCGNDLIHAAEWHTACNVTATPGFTSSGATVCRAGEVQCRASLVDGELVLAKVCYDVADSTAVTVPGGTLSTRCDEDLNCDGTADNTTGAGTNVALVRHALQYECPVSGSDFSCDRTFLSGFCRNAKEHCLGTDTCLETKVVNNEVVVSCGGNGFPVQTHVTGNREGVTLADFGDLSKPTADEAKMGYECQGSDGSVYTWDCTVDTNGVAGVTCSGPRGL